MASDEIEREPWDIFDIEVETSGNTKEGVAEKLAEFVSSKIKAAAERAYTQGRADAWRWIPVSERLPEEESQVLALCGPGFYYLVTREGSTWWSGATILKENRRPTHWMPLPPSKHLAMEVE